jgi:hypothetical protein
VVGGWRSLRVKVEYKKAPDRPHEGSYATSPGAGVTSLGGNQGRITQQ